MAISLLGIIDALSPKDRGSRLIVRDLRYGPLARQQLDIYAPRHRDGVLPVVVFIYGGGWTDGSRQIYRFAARALAALGYLVVVPDYRLVPEVEYPDFLGDCADALDWVVREIGAHGGDPERLALMGHSAGAYNAAMLVLDPGLLEARGHLGRIRGLVGLSGPYDFFPFDGPISLRVFGAVREPKRTQPINHVRPGLPPMFLATGGRDELVLPRNSVALAERVRAAGGQAELKVYDKLRHAGTLMALGRPARRLAPVLGDAGVFLARVLKGQAGPN